MSKFDESSNGGESSFSFKSDITLSNDLPHEEEEIRMLSKREVENWFRSRLTIMALLVFFAFLICIGIVLSVGLGNSTNFGHADPTSSNEVDGFVSFRASDFSCYVDEECVSSLGVDVFQPHDEGSGDFRRRNAVLRGMLFVGGVSAITSVFFAKKACEELAEEWSGRTSVRDCVHFASTEGDEGMDGDVVFEEEEESTTSSTDKEDTQEFDCTGHCYPKTFRAENVIQAVGNEGMKCEDLCTTGTVSVSAGSSGGKYWMKFDPELGYGVRVGKGEGGLLRLNQHAKSVFARDILTTYCRENSRRKLTVFKQYETKIGLKEYPQRTEKNLCVGLSKKHSFGTNIACKLRYS